MNLQNLAAFRGQAWARRVLRDAHSAHNPSSEHPWPGQMDEARRLAKSLGSPRLSEKLATIIQECAAATWISLAAI